MSFWNRASKDRQGGAEKSVKDLFRLDERTIVITGGAGALGLEVGGAVLESGGDVICLDSEKPFHEHWKKLADFALKHETILRFEQCNVTDEESVSQAFSRISSNLRHPIRGLVTCAGISGGGPSVDLPIKEFKHIHDVNVLGTFICAQAFARIMQKGSPRLSGSAVFIASMSGYGVNKGVDSMAYNSSKAAVHQMTRSLASEWGSNAEMPLIRVNSISPGYIRTRLTTATLERPGIKKQWTEDSMLMRLSDTDEYRGAAIYLLSDASSFQTGSDMRIDGGHTAW